MIKIGTRDSPLAFWQATQVLIGLRAQKLSAEIVPIKSEGDLDLVTPLYAMGVQGIFTRALDTALLNHRIDLAVHSLKDVPTQLPDGIVQAAILPRGSVEDVLVYRDNDAAWASNTSSPCIATSSVRRKAQWLHKYPQSSFANLRGNMQTRLQKLASSNWDGAIFAKAGLERIGLLPASHQVLHWMLPAPGQGAIMAACRQGDQPMLEALKKLNDEHTAACVQIERDFLQALEGGCSMPIGALAAHHFHHISFIGNICLPNGSELAEVSCTFGLHEIEDAGFMAAQKLLQNGGSRIVQHLKCHDA